MESIQHKLQQFDPGMVWLDENNRILAMNGVAIKTLSAKPGELIGEEILSIHPEASREKVKWLIDKASCPVNSPPPMTMMINIPERVLLIKVSKMCGVEDVVGTCMIFYDLTDIASKPVAESDDEDKAPRQLFKLPVYKDKKVLLVDLEKVCCIKADGHYSKLYTETEDYFCNLSISDLDQRLDQHRFLKVHRSHIVNLRFAKSFEKLDDQCFIVMEHQPDDVKVPVSRNQVNNLKKILGLN